MLTGVLVVASQMFIAPLLPPQINEVRRLFLARVARDISCGLAIPFHDKLHIFALLNMVQDAVNNVFMDKEYTV